MSNGLDQWMIHLEERQQRVDAAVAAALKEAGVPSGGIEATAIAAFLHAMGRRHEAWVLHDLADAVKRA
jgi:hypothetical protein